MKVQKLKAQVAEAEIEKLRASEKIHTLQDEVLSRLTSMSTGTASPDESRHEREKRLMLKFITQLPRAPKHA